MIVHRSNFETKEPDPIEVPDKFVTGIGRSRSHEGHGVIYTTFGLTVVDESFGQLAEMIAESTEID